MGREWTFEKIIRNHNLVFWWFFEIRFSFKKLHEDNLISEGQVTIVWCFFKVAGMIKGSGTGRIILHQRADTAGIPRERGHLKSENVTLSMTSKGCNNAFHLASYKGLNFWGVGWTGGHKSKFKSVFTHWLRLGLLGLLGYRDVETTSRSQPQVKSCVPVCINRPTKQTTNRYLDELPSLKRT